QRHILRFPERYTSFSAPFPVSTDLVRFPAACRNRLFFERAAIRIYKPEPQGFDCFVKTVRFRFENAALLKSRTQLVT
ncbi:MAG TPA: hypothetical protein VN453_00020, partial [Feifaniaceae bacterium]|nr:hypothetical protein [Feifaniaceae bacterium]